MKIDTLIKKLDAIIEGIQLEMPKIADEIALAAIAMVKNRIVDKKQGIAGAVYSTRPMLATREQFIVKSAFKQTKVEETRYHRNAAGKIKAKGGNAKKVVKKGLWIKFPKATRAVPVMELPQGYKQFREIQGRQANVVDLSLTGMMWKATTIVARAQRGTTYISVIGGSNKEAADKLKWMEEKYGVFLKVTPEEQKQLNELFNGRLQVLIRKLMR